MAEMGSKSETCPFKVMANIGEQMLVRQITEADIIGFHAALDSVARESNFLRGDAAPPVEAVAAFVRQNIEKQNPQLVAIDEQGQVIGWCDIVRAHGRHETHLGELGMGVMAKFRGRGVGRQLLERTVAAADLHGFLRIELSVHADNLVAAELTGDLVSSKKDESDGPDQEWYASGRTDDGPPASGSTLGARPVAVVRFG
jgi:GNAT superfamily N-acetyltransferase